MLEADVSTVSFKGIRADVVTGGFPCQSFSLIGKKLGLEDTRGTLFYQAARCIKETAPKLFLLENVAGLLSHDKGKTFKVVMGVLENLGYNVQWKLVNAKHYNVPQSRRRLIIIGTRKDTQTRFEFPSETTKLVTLRQALKNVPDSPGARYSPARKAQLDLIPAGGNWRNLPDTLRHPLETKGAGVWGGSTGLRRRLSWDAPSLTLLCSPIGNLTERCHPDETRPLTVREYARIQTFPDSWAFEGSLCSQYRQIGNAVPCELAFAFGKQIVRYLDRVSVPATAPQFIAAAA